MRGLVAHPDPASPGDEASLGLFFGFAAACVSSITYIAFARRAHDPDPWENLTLRLVALATTKQEKFKC